MGPLDAIRWGNLAKTLEELDLSGNANLGGRLDALPPFDPDAPAPFKVSCMRMCVKFLDYFVCY